MTQVMLGFASVLAAVTVMTGSAEAGGQAGTVGAGVEYGIANGFPGGAGLGGISANYDAGAYHLGGFLALYDPAGDDNSAFSLGGRFYYHVHSNGMSDFGVGGTLGFVSADVPMGDRATAMFLEPGFQIRLFVQSNVALSVSAGLVIGAMDAEGFALTGQATGAAGFHYYFF